MSYNLNCKICKILDRLDDYEVLYESITYVIVVCPITALPVLIFKEHNKWIAGELAYRTTIEFGNLAEHRFGTKHLIINKAQGDGHNHAVWIACPTESGLQDKFKESPGLLDQWEKT